MTETAETRDQAQDTIAIASATMVHDFVAALLEELRNMPGLWATLDETRQQKIIEQLKTKVRGGIEKAAAIMVRGEFQAVEATLEHVSRKKGFSAAISVKPDALCRHALVDAVGARILVVIADPNRWVERIDEIKAKGNQPDLFDTSANYDPKIDQPGYRRDQDPLAPAGKSWADFKESLKGVDSDAPAEGAAPPADAPPQLCEEIFRAGQRCERTKGHDGEHAAFLDGSLLAEQDQLGESLTPEQESTVDLIDLQEKLLTVAGVHVLLGHLKAQDVAEISAWVKWLAFYSGASRGELGEEVPDRPAWLPLPNADR